MAGSVGHSLNTHRWRSRGLIAQEYCRLKSLSVAWLESEGREAYEECTFYATFAVSGWPVGFPCAPQ